jgi:CDGSH-type Zn-finger protein
MDNAKKMSSIPAEPEGQRITCDCGRLKKKPFTDNKE